MKFILSTNYQDLPCILTDKQGNPVTQGSTVTDFRGNSEVINGGSAPHSPSSTGRVYTSTGQFYPNVFNLQWTLV